MPAAAQLAALPMLLEHGVWAHSVVLGSRALGRVGDLQVMICWEVCFSHISRQAFEFLLYLSYSYCLFIYSCRAPHPEAVVFKGLHQGSHAVCFPGHGEGRYNNVMHS
jgi:hypothetical protein